MIKTIIISLVVIIISIIGLSFYLSPDDLKSCSAKPTSGKCVSVDAIVAISGGDTEARTNEAISFYKNGWGKLLVFSGAAQDKSGPSNAAAMRLIAIEAGVPSENILTEETSESTGENAENTSTILTNNRINSVILVTSAYHQRRAGLEFNKWSEGKIRIVNHPVKSDNQWSGWWWLAPQGWYLAVGEFGKIIAFYIAGA